MHAHNGLLLSHRFALSCACVRYRLYRTNLQSIISQASPRKIDDKEPGSTKRTGWPEAAAISPKLHEVSFIVVEELIGGRGNEPDCNRLCIDLGRAVRNVDSCRKGTGWICSSWGVSGTSILWSWDRHRSSSQGRSLNRRNHTRGCHHPSGHTLVDRCSHGWRHCRSSSPDVRPDTNRSSNRIAASDI